MTVTGLNCIPCGNLTFATFGGDERSAAAQWIAHKDAHRQQWDAEHPDPDRHPSNPDWTPGRAA